MKIGIVIAMEKEIKPILEKVNARIENKYGRVFYIVDSGKNTLYLTVSTIGEINASATAQIMLCAYDPDIIGSVGVCGGLDDNLRFGDIVVGKNFVHYEFDTSALDGTQVGEYPEFGSPFIPCDEGVSEMLAEKFGCRTGTIASADKFVADSKFKNHIIETFGACVCEMECAGVGITALRNGKKFFAIKLVSDHADENATADYDALFEKNADCIANLINVF